MAPRPALQRLADDSAYSKVAAERLDWTYWDSFSMLSTTLIHRMFVDPLGSGGKTLAQTNMTKGGALPQGQNMRIKAIKFEYMNYGGVWDETDLLNWFKMIVDTTISIKIPGKDSLGQWTLSEIMGISLMAQITPSVAGDNISQPQTKFVGIFPLNKAIKWGAIQSYEIEVTHHVAPNANLDSDRVKLGMNGRLIRMS